MQASQHSLLVVACIGRLYLNTHMRTQVDPAVCIRIGKEARPETEREGLQAMSHMSVERNRRKQMNENLKVLRSLTPCFYVKRGDQASIIGGVVEFIKELHQVLQSLESKKRRKSLSPGRSPRPLQAIATPPPDGPLGFENVNELGACCNSPIADVEAKICGPNVVLKTVSRQIPGQIVKIITILESLSFEILHLNISSMDDNVLYSFVIKIGLECQLSVEDLALKVQQSFISYVNSQE